MPKIVQHMYSIRYDGTNGEHIAGTWCTGITFVSDTGTVFTFDGDVVVKTVNVGEWLVISWTGANDPMIFTDADYKDRYTELP
ncbi:hypothetical protein PV735_31555 [Streptomyces turgidiscabies]|uniref:hypothetical protein n=1 Tax=Streptomyces turgidiscabies TaxID=85558 RepID=UPI0029A68795|nr:hypothetical protein [Streptomyces turgidiscabies]MDX3497188.1 hypothetical protein [Streptomyces turgidiscabies]